MNIRWIIWKERFVEKIQLKHGVNTDEVEELLTSKALFRKVEKGKVKGEDLYAAYGQTEVGRYLIVLFVFKKPDSAMPVSARDMSPAERRYYERKR